MVESPLSENCYALAERAFSVITASRDPLDTLKLREWGKQHRIDKEILRKIQSCVLDVTKNLPFQETVFSLIVVGDLSRKFCVLKRGQFLCNFAEKLVLNLSRHLKTGGEMCVFMDNTSLKTVLKKHKLWPSLRWTVAMLKQHGFQIETILYFYPALGQTIVAHNLNNEGKRFKNLGEKINALLKSEGAMVVCRKPGDKRYESVTKQIISKIGRERGYQDAEICRMTKGSGGTFVMHTEKAIVRLPRLWRNGIVERWSNNFEMLRRLEHIQLTFKTPEPFFREKFAGQPYSVESKLSGKTDERKNLRHPRFQYLSTQVVGCLIVLFKKTHTVATITSKEFALLFSEPIASMTRHCDETGKRTLEKLEQWFEGEFLDTKFPLTTTHGDFKRSNFLFGKKGRLEGVFDWDLSRSPGLLLLDLYLYLGFEMTLDSTDDVSAKIIAEFIDKSPLENSFVSRYTQNTYPMPESKLRGLALLTIVYYFSYHCTFLDIEARVQSGLNMFLNRVDEFTKTENSKIKTNYLYSPLPIGIIS
jgi:aminoglycoside phosphotransferase (APT) family kinase protein